MGKEPSGADLASIWIGGFLFWMIRGFKGRFTDMLTEEKQRRNFRVGYLLQVLSFIMILYLAIRYR